MFSKEDAFKHIKNMLNFPTFKETQQVGQLKSKNIDEATFKVEKIGNKIFVAYVNNPKEDNGIKKIIQ